MSEVKEAVEEVDGACCGQDSGEKEESLCKEEEEEEEEEEAICRVCHGEGEEGRPLFHPCRCSGSIKYVHQDCLMVSDMLWRSYCEKVPFHNQLNASFS